MPETTKAKCQSGGASLVPLWDCPCRECWTLEMDLVEMLDPAEKVDYATWRAERE